MVSSVGGWAPREGLEAGGLDDALVRNLYRGEAPAKQALAHARDELILLRAALAPFPWRR
ncbi:hypothetical protein AB5I41_21460 [Sphingomonas sp. MMS24-JH45]